VKTLLNKPRIYIIIYLQLKTGDRSLTCPCCPNFRYVIVNYQFHVEDFHISSSVIVTYSGMKMLSYGNIHIIFKCMSLIYISSFLKMYFFMLKLHTKV
jgi:hypothetical protein